tara:strand:+ start:29 stop:1738 length:1710 start_codon:yes stop_codon:yes gene_type:complete
MANKNVHHIEVKTTGAKKSEKAIKGVNNGLANMAKKAGLAASAYFGSQALLGAIKSSIELFGQQEEAEKKLRFAAGEMTDALIAQANALQQNTRFGDEQIIAQQAYLASLGLTEQQIKDTISASVDLAAATGMTLESAVMNTSKTLSGMAGELGEKLGPAFRELSQDALKAGDGIKFIAEQFGGTAKVDAESFTGQMQQMNNAIGDAQESIGEALSPLIISFANATKRAAEAVSDFMMLSQETKLDRFVREMKDLGINTLEYELALNKIDQNKALQGISGDLDDGGQSQDDLNKALEDYNDLLIESGNLQLERIENSKEEDRFTREQRGRELTNLEVENEAKKKAKLEEIQRLKDETDNRVLINKLILEEKKLLEEIEESNNSIELSKEEQLKKTQARIAAEKKLQEEEKKQVRIAQLKDKFENTLIDTTAEKIGIIHSGNIKTATSNAYIMAEEAYKAMAAIPVVGPALGAIAAATAFAFGMKQVAGVKKAQYGADFVTDGPQMMMVGEGSGPERVQVTPLSDPNIDGPQGQGITLNISGNVLHESFIEDNVIPQIREGLRLGENLGI